MNPERNQPMNWAVIEGSKEDIAWVRSALVGLDSGPFRFLFSEFDFDLLHPTPEALLEQSSPSENGDENEKLYGAKDQYQWRAENWGTKSKGGEGEVRTDSPTELFLRFTTVESAPFGLYKHLENRAGGSLTIAAVSEDIFTHGWKEGVWFYGDMLSKCDVHLVTEDEDGEYLEIPYSDVSEELVAAMADEMADDPLSYHLDVE